MINLAESRSPEHSKNQKDWVGTFEKKSRISKIRMPRKDSSSSFFYNIFFFILTEQISSLTLSKELPTLPLTTFRDFLQQSSYTTTRGFQLRKMAFHRDAIKHILQNLNSLYFHNENKQMYVVNLSFYIYF